MSYIKIGLALFFISFCLFFVGLYLVDGFFIPGFIVLWIGVTLIAIGVKKRSSLLH